MKLHFLVDVIGGKLVGRVKYVEMVGITQWLELPKSIPYMGSGECSNSQVENVELSFEMARDITCQQLPFILEGNRHWTDLSPHF